MKLLSLLADGQIHSGVELAESLSVSRMTVSNRIAEWSDRGVEIEAIPGKGYRLLQPIELLDQARIMAAGQEHAPELIVRDVVTSTNDEARAALDAGCPRVVCFAEYQTEGRGRRGRAWAAVPGGSLCASWGWQYKGGIAALQGLSLAVGVVIAEALNDCGCRGVQLKWPNDLVSQGGKLGGVLIELHGDPEGPCRVVVGVGLNLRLPDRIKKAIDQEVAELAEDDAEVLRRNALAARLYRDISTLLDGYPETGFGIWKHRWLTLHAYADAPVILTGGAEPVEGIASGVNDQGAILITSQGITRPYYGGELSLRKSV